MFKKFMLMNAAGGLGDGGGGAGAGGMDSTPDDSTGGGNSGSGEYVGPDWAREWEGVSDLGADIINDPSLKVFNSPAALLKSYVHAQKQLGKKGVIIPDQTSPKEDWDNFYQKVGIPLEDTKYKESLKLPDSKVFDTTTAENFTKMAHELRVAPAQAQKMFEFFNSQVEEGSKTQVEAFQQKTQAELDALQAEWGPEAYNVKLSKAEAFLKANAGDDFLKYLGESGLGKNAQIVKAFASMAEKLMSEGEIPKGDPTHGLTINDLEREINLVMGDFKGPYYNPSHPDHQRKVDEVLAMNRKLEKARARG